MAKQNSTLLDFESIFQTYQQNEQREWEHDRSKTVGASEAFDCIRKIGFRKRGEEFGYTPDEDQELAWGAAERGNLIENFWVVPALDAELPDGVGYLMAGDDQVTLVDGVSSATPDGLVTDLSRDALSKYGIDDIESDCILVEIKSVDPRVSLNGAKDIHEGQAQMQLGLIRDKTEHKPVYAIILYIDASFLDNIKVFVVKFDNRIYKSGKKRAELIFAAESMEELAPEGKLSDDCKYCEWRFACASVSKESIPEGSKKNTEFDQELLDRVYLLVKEERELSQTEKESKEEKEEVRAQLKQILADEQTRRMKDERFSISWSFQSGRKSIDKEAMQKDGIDISQYEKEGPGFDKMTIKLTED